MPESVPLVLGESPGLRSLMDDVAGQAGAQTLARALTLAEGFHFAIAVCKSTRVAAALQLWLMEILAAETDRAGAVDRVSPYPLDPVAAGPSGLAPEQLVELVFDGLLPSERRASGARHVFLDASRATAAAGGRWGLVFMRLNERRNLLMRDLGGSLTLLLPEVLEQEFARAAPDLWSIRSLSVRVDEPMTALPSARVLMQAHDGGYGSGEDPAALTLEVERLRAQATGGSPTAKRALRVLLLRLAGAHQRLGNLDESLDLIDEAEQIAGALDDREVLAACWVARSGLLFFSGELDEALALGRDAVAELARGEDRWAHAKALGQVADILEVRGELDEALRIRREEQLPVYERLGDVRSLAVIRANLALTLVQRGNLEDAPEIATLLSSALRDARRLRIPEADQIADYMRQLGLDPD